MIKELNQEEFADTYDEPMRLLEEDDETCSHMTLDTAVLDCISSLGLDIELEDIELHYAYANDKKDFCHLGFNWGHENLYLVLVVQPAQNAIHGYTVIDLGKLKQD